MARKRRSHAAAAAQPSTSSSIIVALTEDALLEVLLAAKAAKVLAPLASTNRQLCSLARSRVPLHLYIRNREQAALLCRSHALGNPAFTGCVALGIKANHAATCLLLAGVLSAAHQWPDLRNLNLQLQLEAGLLHLGVTEDDYCGSILTPLAALQQLQILNLDVPVFGAGSARLVGQLQQLTQLELTVCGMTEDAAADLTALSRLTNLQHMCVINGPAVKPAAGPVGPFSCPSSLVSLVVNSMDIASPAPMAGWLTHLPGCPLLEDLLLIYGDQQHPSTHPAAVLGQLAEHNKRLRGFAVHTPFGIQGQGVRAGPLEVAVEGEWRPDAALAALSKLDNLDGDNELFIREHSDWQNLVQARALTALKGAFFFYAPPQEAGLSLAVLDLGPCDVDLTGYDLGLLLLACPLLEDAKICLCMHSKPAPVQPADARLGRHPRLMAFQLEACESWGDAAGDHFAALAPVLGGAAELTMEDWPLPSSSDAARGGLPDLAACAALTALEFGCQFLNEGERDAVLVTGAPLPDHGPVHGGAFEKAAQAGAVGGVAGEPAVCWVAAVHAATAEARQADGVWSAGAQTSRCAPWAAGAA